MANTVQQDSPWRFLAISFLLHAILFLALIISIPTSHVRLSQSSVKIVQAVAIDASQLATQNIEPPTRPSTEINPPEKHNPQQVVEQPPVPTPPKTVVQPETKPTEQQKLRAEAEKQHQEASMKADAEKQRLTEEAVALKKKQETERAEAEKKLHETAMAEAKKMEEEALKMATEEEEKQREKLKKEKAEKQAKIVAEKKIKLAKQREKEMAKAMDEQMRQEQEQLKTQTQDKKALEKKKALAKLAKEQQKAMDKALNDQLKEEERELGADSMLSQGEIDQFKAAILSAIGHHWLVPAGTDKDLSCQLLIHLAPGGVVIDVKTVKSSGDEVLDRSAQTAVMKASPLPVPTEPGKFNKFRELRLTVKPEQVTVR